MIKHKDIMAQTISNLDSLPKSAEDHLWSDYIELLCLLNVDGVVSKADILDRVRERKDLGGEIEDLNDEIIKDASEDRDLLLLEPSSAEIDDEWSLRTDDWFNHLEYRSNVFEDFYPFVLSETKDSIHRKDDLGYGHKLYTFLLLASALNRIGRNTSFLTNSFEVLSALALQTCLPEDANIHVFSRNPLAPEPRRYSGNIWSKLKRLAGDIRGDLRANEEEFSSKNTADEGLDIVGWVPIGDQANGILLVFGQCACTADWPDKQHSSGPEKWRGIIYTKSPPINMIFIPFCFRQIDGSWWKEHKIQSSILMDRPRLLFLLKNTYMELSDLPWFNFVDEVLGERESLF